MKPQKDASSIHRERRRFLRRAVLGTGAVFSMSCVSHAAQQAAPSSTQGYLVPQDPTQQPGLSFDQTGGYGQRSQFVTETRQPMTKDGLHGASFTPLQHGRGIITPSGLHYEVHHGGVPVIDPARHQLTIHGMLKHPTVFTLADLLRFPSVTRTHFLECSDNSFSEWTQPTAPNVQETHGLTSNAEWTGVPLATILREVGVREVGVKDGAAWILAEGSDASRLARSIPIEKAWDDALLVYAQNGEALRPEQGFPLRLLVPGFEGNMNIKWLRRLEVGDQPWHTRSEISAYTDQLSSGKARMFSFVMEAKSLITFPSGGMQLPSPGFYEITGLAWSGRGKIQGVEVSTDGGETWTPAHLQEPVLSKSHTRFRFAWHWDGRTAVLQSRATDETGYVQPALAALVHARGTDSVNHNNAIQSWRVDSNGSVTNGHHS